MALQLTVRGVPFIYYGEEIGMSPVPMPVRTSMDPLARRVKRVPQFLFDAVRFFTHESINRDESRTPMQWDTGPNAGFCPAGVEPWLPAGCTDGGVSVAAQQDDPDSLLSCCRRFLLARKATPALHSGDLRLVDVNITGRDVVGYIRRATVGGEMECACVLLNMSGRSRRLPNPVPGSTLLVGTEREGHALDGESVCLRPWEGVVLVNR